MKVSTIGNGVDTDLHLQPLPFHLQLIPKDFVTQGILVTKYITLGITICQDSAFCMYECMYCSLVISV